MYLKKRSSSNTWNVVKNRRKLLECKEIIKKKLSVNEKKAKPDFLDLDKDGDKEEPMKKAAQDAKKSVKEELDYEGEMAKSELLRIMQNAQMLMSSLDDDTQLEAWVQSKITKAADYLNSVTQYLTYQNTKQGPVDEEAYYLDK